MIEEPLAGWSGNSLQEISTINGAEILLHVCLFHLITSLLQYEMICLWYHFPTHVCQTPLQALISQGVEALKVSLLPEIELDTFRRCISFSSWLSCPALLQVSLQSRVPAVMIPGNVSTRSEISWVSGAESS